MLTYVARLLYQTNRVPLLALCYAFDSYDGYSNDGVNGHVLR